MQAIVLAVFAGTFIAGSLFTSRLVRTVPMQLFPSFLLSAALRVMLTVKFLGAAFAGCLLVSAKGGWH
jgi:hypothetical protein